MAAGKVIVDSSNLQYGGSFVRTSAAGHNWTGGNYVRTDDRSLYASDRHSQLTRSIDVQTVDRGGR